MLLVARSLSHSVQFLRPDHVLKLIFLPSNKVLHMCGSIGFSKLGPQKKKVGPQKKKCGKGV